MIKYLKWLVLSCVFGVLIYAFEAQFQLFTKLAENDFTYICYAIWAVFIFGAFTALFERNCKLEKTDMVGDQCTKLGLLGTIFGLAVTFFNVSTGGFDFSKSQDVETVSNIIFEGIATSLTTTGTGLIASILLSCYIFALGKSNE